MVKKIIRPLGSNISANLLNFSKYERMWGIVNLTRVWQTGRHEKANPQLPTSTWAPPDAGGQLSDLVVSGVPGLEGGRVCMKR